MDDEAVSVSLYQYLCEIIGSEKVIKVRRAFFRVFDYVMSTKYLSTTLKFSRVLSSGSKAEGLDFSGSDLDIMFIKNNVIYNSECDVPRYSVNSLIIRTDKTPPGFAHIEVINFDQQKAKKEYLNAVHLENGMFLSNEKYKRHIFQPRGRDIVTDFVFPTHGPCTSTAHEEFDYLTCFHCQTWPTAASGWVVRNRSSEWPDACLMSQIVEESVLLVPIGSKFGSSQDNPFEWRLSFSVAEKFLIHSFNHVQLACYAIMKLVLKEIIETNADMKGLLCSYFLKTTLFWIIEETGYSGWTANNLLKNFHACISKLIYFVRLGYCPNYFMPENNMFEGKIVGTSQTVLLTLLESIADSGTLFMHRSQTLKRFVFNEMNYMHPVDLSDEDKAVRPLLPYLDIFLLPKSEITLSTFSKILHRITSEHVSKLHKEMLYLCCIRMLSDLCYSTTYDYNRNNKTLYQKYKKNMCYTVLGMNRDGLVGWIWLAVFFYNHKQYKKSLEIVGYVYIKQALKKNFNSSKHIPFFKWTRILSSKLVLNMALENTLFYKDDFMIMLPGVCVCTVDCFLIFISYMCRHNLGEIIERDTEFRKLHELFRAKQITLEKILTLIHLRKAYEISNRPFPFSFYLEIIPVSSLKRHLAKNISQLFRALGQNDGFSAYFTELLSQLGVPAAQSNAEHGQSNEDDLIIPGVSFRNLIQNAYSI